MLCCLESQAGLITLCVLQNTWPGAKAQGELHLQLVYKAFEEDEADVGYREAEAFAGLTRGRGITDVKSAAGMHYLVARWRPCRPAQAAA